ncbi:type VI secretion system tip protein TssI/VgrG, partial [Serratia microhaemolytica]|uniref:type VI secretion system tip protein TssI/VgrG n=1 Tax=Serratia microhaemolytica TaxID=2675110 RepID=UPI001F0C7AC4
PGNEEIFCDEHGRIRVQFRWDRYGNSDDHSSCWIRVSQPWAGQGWGMIAIPRVGQEVVIHFLHGDPDQPIVTGRTYHAVNRAALKLPMAKTQMVLRSKTHKGEGYNELRFEDAKGMEGLFLHAQRDMTTQVRNNRVTEVGANHIEKVQQNQQIEIGQHYHFTAHGNHTLTVQGDQRTEINGQQQRTVQQLLELASARGIRLESGASALELHADGRISLRGKNFNLYATHNGQITASQALDLNDEQQLAEASQWIKNAFAGKPLTVETGANITPEAAATANTTTDGEHNRTEPALSTLNSAAVGRLLAAGALYHQNPETFATIAEQLGGEAPKGFKQILNEHTAGSLIALSAMLGVGKASRGHLQFLGKIKSLTPEKHSVTHRESTKIGEYLDDFKPSPTPLELVKYQAGKAPEVAYIRLNHILYGEVKTLKDGSKIASGGHYLRDPNIKIEKLTGAPDINGVSTGYISVRDPITGLWVKKKAQTTFFPEHWSKRQTAQEIENAFKNSERIPNTETWSGKSSSGLEIQGFYGKPDGTGATAWPVYSGRKK